MKLAMYYSNSIPKTKGKTKMKNEKLIKVVSIGAKVFGGVSVLNVVPGVSPTVGIIIFFAASVLKDVCIFIGDLADDGIKNDSFKG